MERKTKIWLIVGLLIIAAIIAFAIYKGIGASKDTVITTGGGTTTTSNNGIGGIISSVGTLFGF